MKIAALAFLVAGGDAAGAQSVKELMSKAQRESERRAVEDLVRKLQGGDKPAGAAKQSGPSTQPAVAAPAPAKPPDVPPAASAPARAEPVKPVVAEPSSPPEPEPQIAAPKAPGQPAEPPQPSETAPSGSPNVSTPAPPPPRPSIVPAPEVAEPTPPAPPSEPARPAPPPQPAVAAPSTPAPPTQPPAGEADVANRNTLPSVDIEVYFSSGSARITPRAVAILTPLGQALSDSRLAHATFLIAGHTDAVGSADYNRELSRRRAEAVRRFLIDRFGIDGKRLVSRGYGFDQLKLPDRPQAPENRRVQIVNWTSQVPR